MNKLGAIARVGCAVELHCDLQQLISVTHLEYIHQYDACIALFSLYFTLLFFM